VPPPSDQHWLFPTDAGGVHDGNRCYYENGRRMVTLPPGYRFLQNFQCQDPDYLPLAGPHRRHPDRPGVLGVYDLRKHTIISLGQTSPGGNNGIIFHRNGRFLLNYGTPIIIDPGPRIVPYQPPKAFTAGRQLWDADWCWGEDSTIWMVDGATAFVLDWRHGSPVFRALPCQASPDPRIKASAFQWVNPGTATTHDRQASGVAVWGDGRLVACVRTQPALPQPIARLCDKTTWAKGIPREVRELVLYRDGRRAGWYRLPLDLTVKSLPDPMQYFSIPSIRGFKPKPPPLILAREHLAFTKDGTRLAWVVETAKGKRIYVFKVPQ